MTPADLAAALTALGYGAYVPLLLAVCGLFAAIAAVLPPASPNAPAWWRVMRATIDWFGCNVGSARNAVAAPPAAVPVTATAPASITKILNL